MVGEIRCGVHQHVNMLHAKFEFGNAPKVGWFLGDSLSSPIAVLCSLTCRPDGLTCFLICGIFHLVSEQHQTFWIHVSSKVPKLKPKFAKNGQELDDLWSLLTGAALDMAMAEAGGDANKPHPVLRSHICHPPNWLERAVCSAIQATPGRMWWDTFRMKLLKNFMTKYCQLKSLLFGHINIVWRCLNGKYWDQAVCNNELPVPKMSHVHTKLPESLADQPT